MIYQPFKDFETPEDQAQFFYPHLDPNTSPDSAARNTEESGYNPFKLAHDRQAKKIWHVSRLLFG